MVPSQKNCRKLKKNDLKMVNQQNGLVYCKMGRDVIEILLCNKLGISITDGSGSSNKNADKKLAKLMQNTAAVKQLQIFQSQKLAIKVYQYP